MARSKAYPTSGLPECVSLARRIWGEYSRRQMTLEEAAVALGYKGVSGPSRSKISAMKQFGLMEEANSGALKLTQRAIDLLHKPENDPGRYAAAQAALNDVEVFSEILQNDPDASEGAISARLLTDEGFSEVGAKRAAKSFLESVEFVKSVKGDEVSGDDDVFGNGDEGKQNPPPPPEERHQVKEETVSIGRGRATLQWSVTTTPEAFEDLEYWLQGVLRKAKRDIGKAPSGTDDPPDPQLDSGVGCE